MGGKPKEKALGMEDDAAPLGDVAGGTMVEAGGGERTGTADQQNQQSSTNSKAEQHEQQQSNREEEHHCRAQRKESRTRAPPQSTTQRSAAPNHQGGASSRGRKGATLRRGAEGRSTLLDEVSLGHPSVQGVGCRPGWENLALLPC